LVLAACAATAAVAAVPAGAASLTSAQVRELARAAASDPAALERLREADAVDGRRVGLRQALAGATGRALEARLRLLAAGGGPATGGAEPGRARDDARRILSQRRFRRHDAPRPFHGVLTFLSDRVVAPLASAFGGRRVLWVVLAAIVLVAAAAVASRLVGRRAVAVLRSTSPRRDVVDPRRLERGADDAERNGELERAIRLRFRAGLMRLDRARAIELREPVTTGQVGRRLRSPDFDRVAASFDEIVYGGRAPRAPDVELSREGWRSVLAAAGSR
jgi:hypothetical protein